MRERIINRLISIKLSNLVGREKKSFHNIREEFDNLLFRPFRFFLSSFFSPRPAFRNEKRSSGLSGKIESLFLSQNSRFEKFLIEIPLPDRRNHVALSEEVNDSTQGINSRPTLLFIGRMNSKKKIGLIIPRDDKFDSV